MVPGLITTYLCAIPLISSAVELASRGTPLTEINPDGGTMQTDYPDSLSDVSGSLSYPEMPAYNTDPTVTSEDLPLDGLEALEIQAKKLRTD